MTSRDRRATLASALVADKRGVTRAALLPVSALYGLGARLHAGLYALGVVKPTRLATPVISVGNLTLGGTGKTPLVAAIARSFRARGLRVVVLTRGYARGSRQREVLVGVEGEPGDAVARGGDEPALLARELGDVPIVVDSDRSAAGLWAERELQPDVFVLDDGFQHHALARDVDVLVVDATDPFGGEATPPVGRLREPLTAAARADVVVVTRSGRATDRTALEAAIRRLARADVPVFFVDHAIGDLRPVVGGPPVGLERLAGSPVGVITAIGNPAVFIDDLERFGVRVAAAAIYPDHHAFSDDELATAEAEARTSDAVALIATEKDAVKLERLAPTRLPLYAASLRLLGDLEPLFHELGARVEKSTK